MLFLNNCIGGLVDYYLKALFVTNVIEVLV